MGQVHEYWSRICREINAFFTPRFEYHMFYVLYSFLSYLLTLSPIYPPHFITCKSVVDSERSLNNKYKYTVYLHCMLATLDYDRETPLQKTQLFLWEWRCYVTPSSVVMFGSADDTELWILSG
jgi:hypothetical protein